MHAKKCACCTCGHVYLHGGQCNSKVLKHIWSPWAMEGPEPRLKAKTSEVWGTLSNNKATLLHIIPLYKIEDSDHPWIQSTLSEKCFTSVLHGNLTSAIAVRSYCATLDCYYLEHCTSLMVLWYSCLTFMQHAFHLHLVRVWVSGHYFRAQRKCGQKYSLRAPEECFHFWSFHWLGDGTKGYLQHCGSEHSQLVLQQTEAASRIILKFSGVTPYLVCGITEAEMHSLYATASRAPQVIGVKWTLGERFPLRSSVSACVYENVALSHSSRC